MNIQCYCPDRIHQILHLLHTHHAQAFLVGGCVRDMLMHRELHDYDITASALPQDMMAWFQQAGYKVIPTGLKHGTITVLAEKEAVEITTFRKESGYHDHRSPQHVIFSNDLMEDLKRRDFTMNAIAYDPDTGIIDPFHGQKDIKDNIIRCVGKPEERFEEDALRILRALRFSCVLNFTIEEHAFTAIQQHASDLSYISKERIRDEFNKLLMGNRPQTLQYLKDANVLTQIIPEMEGIYDHEQKTLWHIYDVFKHTDIALNHTAGSSLEVKLAIVFHDIAKPLCESFDDKGIAHYKGHAHVSMQIAETRMRELHYDNATIQKVCTLIRYHDYYLHPKRSILRRYLSKFDNNLVDALEALEVQTADNHAKHPERALQLIQNIEECKAMMLEMEKENDMFSLKDLCINGHDLKQIGYTGKQIGEQLQYLLERVMEDPTCNTREQLIKLLLKKSASFRNR